jgi:tetratricopeptide (TPR) repeat protein
MEFRLGSHPWVRVSLLGLLAAAVASLLFSVAAQRPSTVRRISAGDSLARAKHFAWLNNWSAAARVLERLKQSGRLEATDAAQILSRAVEIRGNIESLPLPSAAKDLDAMLTTETVSTDAELRLQILAMKGDVEFQYDLTAAERTWAEVGRLAAVTDQVAWRSRAEGELGCIAFLNGEVYTALKRVVAAYLKAEVSNDVAAKVKTLTALGEGLAEFGRPADAIRFFNRALKLSAENPDAYFPFTAYLGKARLLLGGTSPAEGRRMLSHALVEARREQMRVRETRILTVLGDDAIRRGDRAGAARWLSTAVDIARRAGLHRIEADAGSKLASVFNSADDFDRAGIYAESSVAAAGLANDSYHLPQYLAALGQIERNRGDLSAAKAAYERATQLVTSLFSDLPNRRHASTLVATMGSVFQGYFELALNDLKDLSLAFEILESARARGLVDRIRASQFGAPVEGKRDLVMIEQIADLNRRLSREQDSLDRRRLLDRLWEAELRSLRFTGGSGGLRFLSMRKPVRLWELQASLRPGDLLIEYSLGSSQSVALGISRDQAVPFVLKGRNEIESAIARHLAAVQEKRDSQPEGKVVYDLLLAPVALVRKSTRLIIVPDGKLHLAPLAAAVDPQGRYLAETHVVSFAPSATAFCLLSTSNRFDPKRIEVLGVGGAQYPTSLAIPGRSESRIGGLFSLAPPRFPNLARSGTEVADLAIVEDWETQSITGWQATESVLKRLSLASFDVLHFSLHSAIDRYFPERSGLVLTSHSAGEEDDLLQAREIMALKLNAELVTLSASHGAAGTPEGIAGMNSPC